MKICRQQTKNFKSEIIHITDINEPTINLTLYLGRIDKINLESIKSNNSNRTEGTGEKRNKYACKKQINSSKLLRSFFTV